MIAPQLSGRPTAADQWAYATLVDLAALLPAASGVIPAVVTRVLDIPGEFDVADHELRISRSVVDQVVAVAGAGSEQQHTGRDRHGRVPSSGNPLVQQGTARTLPMHHLASRFARAGDLAAGRPLPRIGSWPAGKSWAAAITHDVDVVAGWPLFAAMRWAELLRKGELGRLSSAVGSAVAAAGSGPVEAAIQRLMEIESANGVRATWFVLAGDPTLASWRRGDVTYRLDSRAARALLERLAQAQHEVGLHGSLDTADSGDLMRHQREVIHQVTGTSPAGIRQHFLRMTPGSTATHAQAAGFRYDSTFGFADRSGFRLGTADVLRCWNATAADGIDLAEAPLAWMDRTFSKYQGEENPERWVDDALELARTCREAGGLWVGLWHPNVVPALGYPGAYPAFDRLVRSLVMEGAYIAPLQELVSWRTARRNLRGMSTATGEVVLTSTLPGHWTVDVHHGGTTTAFPWPEPVRG